MTTTETFGTVRTIEILGVLVSGLDLDVAVASIQRWIRCGSRTYVCVTGVHGIMESRRDARLRDIHNRAGMVTPDGMPLVWLSHWAGRAETRRVTGTDLLAACCARSEEEGWRHFFYGGGPGVGELLVTRLQERWPKLRAVGTHSPPFRDWDVDPDASEVELINNADPDIVWVGLSTPKQERWMALHRPHLKASVLVGVGAAFDFHAGLKRRAPRWMQEKGLEWLYRLAAEPQRLWRRYVTVVPSFACIALRDAWRMKSRRRVRCAGERHEGK